MAATSLVNSAKTEETTRSETPVSARTPTSIPLMTAEEEESIIHTRITNDEKPLKRILKRFHQFTTASHPTLSSEDTTSSADDKLAGIESARDAFLVELATFHLALKKSVMVCEAEERQVEEYQRERLRIEDERGKLGGQIEQLKTSLEHAQMVRLRKMEYDQVAEKVNALPSRAELEQSINELENDMVLIRAEHDIQTSRIQDLQGNFDAIVSNILTLRASGKEAEQSTAASPTLAPLPDATDVVVSMELGEATAGNASQMGATGEQIKSSDSSLLNPAAAPFLPSSASASPSAAAAENDIEMGEVEEEAPKVAPSPKVSRSRKKAEEELEEGEASDVESDLSSLSDDE